MVAALKQCFQLEITYLKPSDKCYLSYAKSNTFETYFVKFIVRLEVV